MTTDADVDEPGETMARISVLIADDHALIRNGIADIINRENDLEVVAEASNGLEAEELFKAQRPDVGLLDLRMPKLDGLDVLRRIMKWQPASRLIVLTTYDDEKDIAEALKAGARAYLVKDTSANELITCIRNVAAGQTYIPPAIGAKLAAQMNQVQLTVRELTVLKLIAKGDSNRVIAETLHISEATVKVHATNLFHKLDVTSRTEAIGVAIRRGLIRFGHGYSEV